MTVLPRYLVSTTTAQIAIILNGRGLSQPPPFLPRMTCALLSSHLNTLTPLTTHRLHTSATMSFFSGIHCAEQFMMVSKARLFGDDTALSATPASDDPREQKRLGCHVRHFDRDFWQQECENSTLRGNLAKFSQNKKMRLALVHTVPTPPRRREPP